MIKTELTGQAAQEIDRILLLIATENDLPVMLKARINKLRRTLAEVLVEFEKAISPMIRKHTGQSENEPAVITSRHENFEAFMSDPEVKEILTDTFTFEISPMLLKEFEQAEYRLEKRSPPQTLKLDNESLHKLMHTQFVVEEPCGS